MQWWDVGGTSHAVSVDTQRALLAAMGLPVATTDDARAHLAALADAQDRRALPAAAVVAANAPAQVSLTLTAASVRARGPLRLALANGTAIELPRPGEHAARRGITAADGRRSSRRCSTFPRCPRAGIGCSTRTGRSPTAC